MMRVPEPYRVKHGPMRTTRADGNNGLFAIPLRKVNSIVVASDGEGWEHVSVSLPGIERCPTWEEMCMVKELFWSPDACVMQLHPPETEHVNNHLYCLHLWRPIGVEIPMPPSIMVGVKELGVLK